jgi:hypothetical protein
VRIIKGMRIKRDPPQVSGFEADLARAAHARGVAGRVCGDACNVTCGHCASTQCQCLCSPYCPDAARALSSDPQLHPIEPAIVALVYAMKRLGLFGPCWSCEGHTGPDGALWKLPTVWFYSDATAHLRLLADGLAKLRSTGRLSTPWRVAVTFSDPDNPRTTFALEPAPAGADPSPTLAQLQRDADEIARALQSMMAEGGLALQREIAFSAGR